METSRLEMLLPGSESWSSYVILPANPDYAASSFSCGHQCTFHPEMVFLANLGVNLHVCLCGDLQVASAQTLDFLDIGQKSSFPDWKPSSTAKTFPDGD
ncbi:hypothetical protein TRIP_B250310 [uncultured Desulfatiglans sp.]|uniref:Uncharacterized protein n=1 Tax=Uncultured Desulfatiglans sp. TaxID=1748965 RepID=A0A653A576_UNCDX|nr:hypothetical protein TRIP_B250310 [uncultured Desulfatiglans sp.]